MLSDEQRRRLEQEKNSFEQSYELQSEKIARLRNALVIETDPSRKFQYEQQIKNEETELKRLTDRLDEIEEQLQSAQSIPAISKPKSIQQKNMIINGQQKRKLQEALINAFPNTASLEQMLSFELDINLRAIAGEGSLQDIVFKLIQTAESQGWIEDLVRKALNSNPGNLKLKAINEELLTEGAVKKTPVSSDNLLIKLTQQQKILILTAIPHGLRLDKEIREIEEAIRRATNRDLFEIRIRTAVRPQDIRRAIAEEQPQIVHFCGHGLEDGSLLLEDDGGNNKPVSPEGLAALFNLHADYVNCVLLNACHSEKTAIAISQYINYTIGMNQPIEDKAAIAFAQGFYDGLGFKNSGYQNLFQRAFDEGMVAIQLDNFSQGSIPVLKKKLLDKKEQIKPKETTVTNPEEISLLTTPSKPVSLQVFQFDVVTVDVQSEWLGGKSVRVKRDRRIARCFTEDIGNSVVLELVYIPGDKFLMGSPETEAKSHDDERPQHQVTVEPFLIGKYAVTQVQWQVVASLSQVDRDLNPNPSYFKGDDRPIECISWYDAIEFCKRLSQTTGRDYRLPSEVEWEYACRAGTTTPFHSGETITTELANYNGNYIYSNGSQGEYRKQTTSVGSFPANTFGLYDMHGNIWEWCADTLPKNYEGATGDGSAWLEDNDTYNQKRLLRGGSWHSHPENCRCAYRYCSPPGHSSFNIGFRVVSVQPFWVNLDS